VSAPAIRRFFVAIGIAIGLVIAVAGCSQRAASTVGWGTFLRNISDGQVATVVQQGTNMTVTGVDGKVYTVTAPGNPNVNSDWLQDFQIAAANGGRTFDQSTYSVEPVQDTSWIGLVITGLVPLVVIGGFIAAMMRQAGKMQKRAAATPVAPATPTPADRLRQLEDARNARLITDDEYAAKRAKILDEM
jgi:ATP-dependent Zn protease